MQPSVAFADEVATWASDEPQLIGTKCDERMAGVSILTT